MGGEVKGFAAYKCWGTYDMGPRLVAILVSLDPDLVSTLPGMRCNCGCRVWPNGGAGDKTHSAGGKSRRKKQGEVRWSTRLDST